ncbi:hypothetical protein MBLNU457_4147t1 [Dothideomycetes sp. NU457]
MPEKTTQENGKIHILGLGAIGKLVAHSLRNSPNPRPVTLIAHRWRLYRAWTSARRQAITIEQDGYRLSAKGFEMEYAPTPWRFHSVETDDTEYIYRNPEGLKPHEAAQRLKEQRAKYEGMDEKARELRDQAGAGQVQRDEEAQQTQLPPDQLEGVHNMTEEGQDDSDEPPPDDRTGQSDEPIYHLILSVKAPRTVSALSSIKHRLRPESTVCILQNGMGTLDIVKKEVFPDPATRPNFILGLVTHGANTPKGGSAFFAIHAGHGTIALGVQQREEEGEEQTEMAPSTRFLMQSLTRVPVLAAVGLPQSEFLQQQLEKLAQNAVINPLTVMIDARNGSILYNFHYTRVMRLILGEVSLVVRSLPEFRGLPNVATRFSVERLETLVVGIAGKTAQNISSMLSDVRNGVNTEIDYINGYIYRRGQEVGITCVANYMMLQMVMGKNQMIKKEMMEQVPMDKINVSTDERVIDVDLSRDYKEDVDPDL